MPFTVVQRLTEEWVCLDTLALRSLSVIPLERSRDKGR